MYINVRVHVPLSLWFKVMKFSLRHHIQPACVWALMIDHGFDVVTTDFPPQ